MRDLNIKIHFFSPWHCGSGLSAGADTDSLVIKDLNSLPFIPGKTLKGLIREAVEDYVALKGIKINLAEAFGKEASSDECVPSGKLFFTNAELSPLEKQSIISNHVEEYLYNNKVATAIDKKNGITKEHSLRTIETTIPCELHATIMHVDESLAEVIEPAIGFIKRMGTGRNRGLGRCKFIIEKGGNE